ncbi:MAG: hypothetical protein UT55_C0084G0011 [Candidatus Peregrinibacteria bacterium GW2011_GWE2_39_6]|nr:MAG: hypothetical protein UT55_C0084G0011 [Candidatus Peregrinibacteria bacterium GW2011_GWE2_39_6]
MNLFKNYLDQLKKGLDQMDISILEEIAHILFEALIKERLVFVIGNGGSASTASHLACDLGKNTILDLKGEEKRFRVICPSDNVAMSTAYANDIGYDAIFEQPLKNFLQKKDILIAISASGNSLNVLNAVKYAKKKGAITIGFVGFSGGKLRQLCDYVMHFPENHYGRSEDAHLKNIKNRKLIPTRTNDFA